MKRRNFLFGLSAVPAAWLAMRHGNAAKGPVDSKAIEQMRSNWKMLLAKDAKVTLSTEPLKLADAEWKARLTREQYHILREEGTERAGTSALNNEKRAGVYACAGCGLPLFTSEMKYDSGTGWPSFFTSIPGHLATKTDYKLILPRTEYHCVRCGGHQGHVFEDGPQPTRERWCNNGIALSFIPAEGKA